MRGVFSRIMTPYGELKRSEYWLWSILPRVLLFVAARLVWASDHPDVGGLGLNTDPPLIVEVIFGVLVAAFCWISLLSGVRRLRCLRKPLVLTWLQWVPHVSYLGFAVAIWLAVWPDPDPYSPDGLGRRDAAR